MRKLSRTALIAAATGLVLFSASAAAARVNGTKTLDPPLSLTPASGSGTITVDTLMSIQPSSIDFRLPAGATVTQVLLNWEGDAVYPSPGDENITVNGISLVGRLIEGPTILFQTDRGQIQRSGFQADITSLDLVTSGSNTLTLEGLTFSFNNDRAEVVVVYDDGSSSPAIGLREGKDHTIATSAERE